MAHTRSFFSDCDAFSRVDGTIFPLATLEQEKKYPPLRAVFHILDGALLEQVSSESSAPNIFRYER